MCAPQIHSVPHQVSSISPIAGAQSLNLWERVRPSLEGVTAAMARSLAAPGSASVQRAPVHAPRVGPAEQDPGPIRVSHTVFQSLPGFLVALPARGQLSPEAK